MFEPVNQSTAFLTAQPMLLGEVSWADLLRTLSMRDWGTRMVITGTVLLGMAAGVIGVFMLMRKRSLLGDALSHAMLPGVALAFIVFCVGLGFERSLPILLLGATITGIVGALSVVAITRWTQLREDAALAIVLSVFFGFGIALISVVNQVPGATGQAGLEGFIYGKTTNLVLQDAVLIATVAAICFLVVIVFRKEFTLVTFDSDFAASQGWPAGWLDLMMTAVAIAVIVVGIQAVGLILVIALLIIPAASARFWTQRIVTMLILAGIFGGLSGWLGTLLSSMFVRAPAGAMIVIAAGILFLISMVFGSQRGMARQWLGQRLIRQRMHMQHLLRALYEAFEQQSSKPDAHDRRPGLPIKQLLPMRSWTRSTLNSTIRRATAERWTWLDTQDQLHLTDSGLKEAARITRQHRLWEAYLLTHAETAPHMVDHEADRIEHILSPELIAQLEKVMRADPAMASVPASVHEIQALSERPDAH
jgi:manganese/zinc/iron transport system permease protein